MRTPRSSATRRSPRTSSAGCTVAAVASNTPVEMRLGASSARYLAGPEALERRDAESIGGAQGRIPGAELHRGGRRPQEPAGRVVALDAVPRR